jgi:Mg-chelatase subunit ChlD
VALYPPEGTFYSDNPFIILDGDWVRPAQRQGAERFQEFLAEEITPELAARSGFRPADLEEEAVAPVSKENGADPAQPERVLGLPEPRTLDRIRRAWREDRKPANVLLVVDTSGSMAEENRLVRAKQGLEAFFAEVGKQDSVGLNIFSDRLQSLIPVTPFRQNERQMRQTVENLIADGGTAVYDATIEGFESVRADATPERINAVVVLTDGEDTDSAASARTGGARPGRLGRSGARVHDRLQRRRGGRRRGARADRGGLRRPGLRGRHRGHRGRLPEYLELLLMPGEMRPYSRSEYNRALVVNALTQPFNVCLLAGIVIAGLLLDLLLPLLAVGIVVYGIAVARTYFDEDEASKVLERERTERRKELEAGRLDPGVLAPPIAGLLSEGRRREARIRDAIDRAELPYEEVSQEVDRFIPAMEDASRAAPVRGARQESHRGGRAAPHRGPRRRGQGRADCRARESALRATAHGGPAAALLRRDGAHPRRARHRARQPRLGLSIERAGEPRATRRRGPRAA